MEKLRTTIASVEAQAVARLQAGQPLPTLYLLRETFGAKILLDIEDVAAITGVKSKTIRNKIPADWPIHAQLVQGRWRMHIVAVAEAIDSGALDFYRRRRRGRPRKDSKTQQAALS